VFREDLGSLNCKRLGWILRNTTGYWGNPGCERSLDR
jgi:hypothetical protein